MSREGYFQVIVAGGHVLQDKRAVIGGKNGTVIAPDNNGDGSGRLTVRGEDLSFYRSDRDLIVPEEDERIEMLLRQEEFFSFADHFVAQICGGSE